MESHLDLNERLGEAADRDVAAVADSMAQLAELELDAGDVARAAELEAGSRALLGGGSGAPMFAEPVHAEAPLIAAQAPGSGWSPRPVPDLTTLAPSEVGVLIREVVESEGSVEAGRVYQLLVQASGSQRIGRRIRAALDSGVRSAVRKGTVMASAPDGRGSSDRRVLRPAGAAEANTPVNGDASVEVDAVADEWGRHPWRGWVSHPVPALLDLSPRQVADLVVEVVEAEGPVMVSRVAEVLRAASGAARMSKSVSDAVESGIGSGVRREDLVIASGRRGDPGTRVLRSATQPDVALRTVGDRDASTIPAAEIAELGRRVAAREPSLDREGLKRRVGSLLGAGRHTSQLDELLEAAIP